MYIYMYIYEYINMYKHKYKYVYNLLHRIECGSPKFFSKTFRFSITFYSTLQIFGGRHFRQACRSRKKESRRSEITYKQSEPAGTIFKIEQRREFVRALCYEQCPKNSFKTKGSTMLRGCWFWMQKLCFRKNFGKNFNAVERVKSSLQTLATKMGSDLIFQNLYLLWVQKKSSSGFACACVYIYTDTYIDLYIYIYILHGNIELELHVLLLKFWTARSIVNL